MNKIEFIEGLKAYLEPEVDTATVRENIEYYRNYISEEVSKGRTEAEVVNELGDPWLIARTIIELYEGEGKERISGEDRESYGSSYDEERSFSGGSLWNYLLKMVVLMLVIGVIFAVMAGLVRILLPILVPLLFVGFVYRIFKNRE